MSRVEGRRGVGVLAAWVVLAGVLGWAVRAAADDIVWDRGAGTAAMGTAANWCNETTDTNDDLPGADDDVRFGGSSGFCTPSDTAATWNTSPGTILSLTLASGYTSTVTMSRASGASGVNGDVAVNSGTFAKTGAASLTISGGDFTVTSPGAVSATTGTVTLQGTGTLGGTGTMSLAALTLSSTSAATTTLGGTVSASTCLVGSGLAIVAVSLDLSSQSFTCSGTLDMRTRDDTTTLNAGSGTLEVDGVVTLGSSVIGTIGSVIFNGQTATVDFNDALTVSSSSTVDTVTFNAGTSGTLDVTGLVTLSSDNTGSSTVSFNGQSKAITLGGGLTIDTGDSTAADLTFTPSTGTNDVNGAVTITEDSSDSNASVTWADPASAYTMTVSGAFTITDTGSGTLDFTPNIGTIEFDGSSAQAVTMVSGSSFNNVSHTSSNTVTFGGSAFTIGGTFSNTGGTVDFDVNTTISGAMTNTATLTETGGVILHPATSLTLTDASGTAVTSYGQPDAVFVTLIDEDENLNGTSADTVTGNLTLTAATSGDTLTISSTTCASLQLSETGAATETFRNTVGIPVAVGTASAGDCALQVASAADTLTVTYTDNEEATDNAASDTALVGGSPAVLLTTAVNTQRAAIGEMLLITATATNQVSHALSDVRIELTLPPGFTYRPGSARLDNAATTEPTGSRTRTFSLGTLSANATTTLTFQLLVTSAASPGQHTATLQAVIP